MNRRTVTASLIFATPAYLAACSGKVTPSQLVTDADLVTSGVDLFAPIARLNASPADQANIDRAVEAVHAADKAIQTAAGADTTLSVRSLQAGVMALVPLALSYLPKDSSYALAAQAALALLPAILRAAGLASAPMAAKTPGMSEAQARLVLRGAR